MEFKYPYLMAMREQAPRMFNQLRRTGMMDAHLQQKSDQAHQMLREMLAREPKDAAGIVRNPQAQQAAEERGRAMLTEFPAQGMHLEPPDDLTPRSRAPTSASSPAS